MSSAVDKQAPIARIYAEAMATIAAEVGREDETLAELDGLVAALDATPGLETFLASPLIEEEAHRTVLERALRGRASDLLVDTLQVMRRKGRLELLRALARAYREIWMKRRGRVEVRVASAVPLSDQLRSELAVTVEKRIGKQAVLLESVDPALLGGLVVSVGDDRFDSSVASALVRLQGDLLERAGQELVSGTSYITNSE